MSAALRSARETGFTLLPVILAMSLIAAIAFLLNRDNGVNARMIANRSDLDRARYAAEAGLQAVNFVVQGMGCGAITYPVAGGPVTNNIGGATYSAYASRNKLTGTPPSPLSFITSTGSYNGASVTLTRNTVYVYQPSTPRTTVVVRPGESGQPLGNDTSLNIISPDRNYGSTATLRFYTGNYQPLLRFDLAAFPTGSRAISWYDGTTLQPGATLSLFQTVNAPSPGAWMNAQLVTQSWVAGTGIGASPTTPPLVGATWYTYDGTNAWSSPGVGYAPVLIASTPYPSAPGWVPSWVNWDLTNAATAWMNSVYPNYGIWLVDSGASVGNSSYVSSDDTVNTTLHPTLTLNTLLPCGATAPPSAPSTAPGPAPTTTATLGAVADTYITADTSGLPPNDTRNFGADTTMYVGEVGTGPNLEERMLLKFDLSGIPPGSRLTSATLRLLMNKLVGQAGANSTKSLDAYALTESFVEGTSPTSGQIYGASWEHRDYALQWATWGGTYDAATTYATGRVESSGVSPLPAGFSNGWVTWDLTALAQGWVDGVIVNNGILVKSRYPGDITYKLEFLTKENNSAGGKYAPQLVVVYQ